VISYAFFAILFSVDTVKCPCGRVMKLESVKDKSKIINGKLFYFITVHLQISIIYRKTILQVPIKFL